MYNAHYGALIAHCEAQTISNKTRINMFMRRTLFLAVSLLPGYGFAQSGQEIETLVVTGSYAPLPAPSQTSSVSVIDSDTLRALNKSNLVDVLKSVPGLSVEELGGPGGLSAVSIRGGESNFTLVLIDGIPQNDPTNSRGGSFDFSNLDPASVEQPV
jgi:iron complex outermembrane receptor protein/vitamin B12 transporter